MMKIPFQDNRSTMNRRWTDIIKMNHFRFQELSELLERCDALGKDELFELKQIIEKKLTLFNI
jgi:hypothetical protein